MKSSISQSRASAFITWKPRSSTNTSDDSTNRSTAHWSANKKGFRNSIGQAIAQFDEGCLQYQAKPMFSQPIAIIREFNKRLEEIRRFMDKFTFFYDKIISEKVEHLQTNLHSDFKKTKFNLDLMHRTVSESKLQTREAQETFYRICDDYIRLTHKALIAENKINISQLKTLREKKDVLELNYRTSFVT